MKLQGFMLLASVLQASGQAVELECGVLGSCAVEGSSLLALRNSNVQPMAVMTEEMVQVTSGGPVAMLLVDEHDANHENVTGLLQSTCVPPPGVTCMCSDAAYPCYKASGSGCSCWGYSTKDSCESAGGSFCERPASCVDDCELCKDTQSCSSCKAGYMLVYGKCTKKPPTKQEEWLKAHNVLRCIHGAPPVTWLAEAAASAQTWVNGLTSLVHSQSYSESPPAGPAGENLAMGHASPEAATSAWYEEVLCCESLPGCQSGPCTVGHFTAMVWKGVKKIGCATNEEQKIDACRYWSGDTLSLDTANMGGGHAANVLAATKSLQSCIDEADA